MESINLDIKLNYYKELYNELLQNLNGVSYRVELGSNKISFFPEKIAEITGYSSEDFYNNKITWFSIIHPDDMEIVKNEKEKLTNKKNYTANNEYRIIHKSGKVKWIRDIARLISEEDDSKIILQGTVFEITNQKETQELNKERVHTLLSIIDFLPDSTFAIDLNGKVIAWNKAIEKMTGVDKKDIIGKGNREYAKVFYGEPRPMIIDLVLGNQKDFGDLFKYVTRKGNTLFAEVYDPRFYGGKGAYLWGTAAPLLDNNGKVIGAIESVRDITESKLLEEALADSDKNFRALVNSLPDIILVHTEGIIKYVNSATDSIAGYQPGELIGESIFKYIYEEDHKKTLDMLENRKEGKPVPEVYELRMLTNTGDIRDIEIRASIIDYYGQSSHLAVLTDVTQKKRIVEALSLSETKFSKVFHISPDAINISRVHDGVFIDVNKGYTLLTGYAAEEVIGKSYNDFDIWVNDFDKAKFMKRLLINREVNNLEVLIKTKQGKIKTGLISARIIDINGEMCSLTITRDISDRELAMKSLQESEETFRRLFEDSADPILLMDVNCFIDCNQAALSLFGYNSKNQIVGKRQWQISPEFQADGRYSLEKAVEMTSIALKKGYNRFEWTYIKQNGTPFPAEVTITSINLKGNQIFYVMSRDITDRKSTIDALQKSEQKYRLLAENLKDFVWELNKDLVFTFASPSIEEIGGYKQEEVEGQHLSKILTDESIKYIYTLLNALKAKLEEGLRPELTNYEVQLLHKNGNIIDVEVSINPIIFNNGFNGIRGVTRDITDRKKAEEELIKAKDKAEVSEQLKSAFLAQMSHEIRSPLYRILGYVTLIHDYIENLKSSDTDEVKEFFLRIDLSSKRLIRTIDSILNMSELQTKSYSPSYSKQDIFLILKSLHREHQIQAQLKGIEFRIEKCIENTFLWCDEYSITQIFANLIDNALKYTFKGSVQIIIDNDENNCLYVEVRDTGVGMSNDFMNKMFTPFTQEEIGYTRKFDGNGLGLALVKNYCDLNNALVTVHSEKGEGSVIRVLFSSRS